MTEITAATEIDASAEAVWGVLTDLARFHEWNPFIRQASGSTDVGGRVDVHVRPPIGVPLHFHATVSERRAPHELKWSGQVLAPWLARGDHVFTIDSIGEHRVRFVQRETFSGILPRLAARLLAREAVRGFEAMNRALAARAEGRS